MKQKFKIIFSFLLLAVILFAAVPRVYIHSLFGDTHSVINSVNDVVNVSEEDCDFEKFDTPVYYSVFKFILNFLPLKETKQTSFLNYQKSIQQYQYKTLSLKDPLMA